MRLLDVADEFEPPDGPEVPQGADGRAVGGWGRFVATNVVAHSRLVPN